jgi:hypothetical protein
MSSDQSRCITIRDRGGSTLRLMLDNPPATAVVFPGALQGKTAATLQDAVLQACELFVYWLPLETSKLEVSGDGTLKDAYEFIQHLPIPHHEKLRELDIDCCMCNMGHCRKVINIEVHNKYWRTYGDLMKGWGTEECWLTGDQHPVMPNWIFCGVQFRESLELPVAYRTCRSMCVKDTGVKLDPELAYMTTMWST